jgi:DNA topoisomerase-2
MVVKTKNLTKKEKIVGLPISKFIDTKFRDYAVYVLTSRGIPDFYDGLTPVQRYILKNAPTSFQKTLSVVGKAIQSGYHHGNSSLEGAISKLARPFGNSLQLLDGYGFFGSEVSPDAAAARYTSVKISPRANEILNKYKHLHVKEEDGPYEPLWMDIPIGLAVPIVGIAVGYKSTILPRKIEHVKEFLEGKRTSVEPYFEGYTGVIEPYKELGNAWIMSSKIAIMRNSIRISELPPILKYSAVLKKLEKIMNSYEGRIKIINNSNIKVDIEVLYTGGEEEQWNDLQLAIIRAFSIIVTETVVLVKDGQVLVYDSVEQYLTDYKYQVKRLEHKNAEYELKKLKFDLGYNEAKKLFIEFVLKQKRTNDELSENLKLYNPEFSERLERLTSRKFTKDELEATKIEIANMTKLLRTKEKEFATLDAKFQKLVDPTLERGVKSNKSTIDLFETEDMVEIDGVTVWTGDAEDEEEEGF